MVTIFIVVFCLLIGFIIAELDIKCDYGHPYLLGYIIGISQTIIIISVSMLF
jgi:hypothetical protein